MFSELGVLEKAELCSAPTSERTATVYARCDASASGPSVNSTASADHWLTRRT